MSPEQNIDTMFLAHTTSNTYEELKDKLNGDQNVVHEEFIVRLSRGVKRSVLNQHSLQRRLCSLIGQQVGKREATRKSSPPIEEVTKA